MEQATETRGPITQDEAIEQIKQVLEVNTLIDGLRKLREWQQVVMVQPIVWTDKGGALHVAPLTVRQVVQVITALENMPIK